MLGAGLRLFNLPPGWRWASLQLINNLHLMNPTRSFMALALLAFVMTAAADHFKLEPGFTSLFNGQDLTGWGYVTNNFDGKTASMDGRYSAQDGVLTVHPRTPRLVQKIWTTQEFPKNFILKIEFRAAVNADSGIFLRKPQLQCRDYLVAGPYKTLKKYKAQDWNEIIVTVRTTSRTASATARCWRTR